jgi:hypothetical protein
MENQNLIELIEKAFDKKPEFGVLHGVRILRKGRPNKRIIKFFSRKNNAHIPCESRLEAARALQLEFDSNVTSYRSQPLRIFTPDTHYVPDFLIKRNDGLYEFNEVKPRAKLISDVVMQRLDSIAEYVRQFGVELYTVDETTLNKEPDRHNREYLYRHVRCDFSEILVHEAKSFVSQSLQFPLSLGELRKLLDDKFSAQGLADELIRINVLAHGHRAFLEANTPIFIEGGAK